MGIAGTDNKCEWLVKELGFDAAINYSKKTSDQLYLDIKQACPKGIRSSPHEIYIAFKMYV